jgi:anaerobic selenocysteine-containing dehydrogenase
MLKVNQPGGFDCPGCAWPDPRQGSSFEFCENGAKAVSWEATNKRTTPAFFAQHTVSELWNWEDFALEWEGRLTHPMKYDAASDKYLPIAWDQAFAEIGTQLRALPDPNMAEFYASGRASNEAAFLYQLMAREYSTNNFPDCSDMCHEATSVGLPESIGVGKGTVTLEDFDECDAIFSFGHNPGTNHPRMLATLRAAHLSGALIVVFNPLKERSLERFKSRQHPLEMTVGKAVPIATSYYQLKVGGDAAVVQGMMKALLARDAADVAAGGPGLLDRDFIRAHTAAFEALVAGLDAIAWDNIESVAGLARADIQATGPQSVTVEDSMSMVHASRGTLPPASPELKSEPAIVAGIARATLPDSKVDWEAMIADYRRIRDAIEAVFPDFDDYNERVKVPRGFRLDSPAGRRVWRTASGRANFIVSRGEDRCPAVRPGVKDALVLATVRSHDQYNTTIYGKNDRYRGVTGRRDAIFCNAHDLAERGLEHGDLVDIEAVADDGNPDERRIVRGFVAVAFDIARGAVAAYYPEANSLVSLDNFDPRSGTPSYKSVPVVLRRSQAPIDPGRHTGRRRCTRSNRLPAQ